MEGVGVVACSRVIDRYKNRQIVGPNAKCVGIDMNRCVSAIPSRMLMGVLNAFCSQELGISQCFTFCLPLMLIRSNTGTQMETNREVS